MSRSEQRKELIVLNKEGRDSLEEKNQQEPSFPVCFIITQLGHTTRVQKKPDGLIRWSPSTESAPYISWHLTLEWGPPLHWTFPRVERSTTRGMDFLDLSAVVQKNDIRYAPVALYPPQSNTSSSLPLVVLINILKRRKKSWSRGWNCQQMLSRW